MAFSIPTYDELRLAAVAIVRALRPTADTADGSDVDIETRGWAHMADGLHKHILQALKALMPHLSWAPWLWEWLYLKGQPNGQGGYGQILAATSSGTDALRVTCTSGTPTINTTHTLQDAAGRSFRVNEVYAFAGPGTADVDIVSTSTGSACNLESGTTLWFDSPPAGIQQESTLVADMDGACDDQTESEGREAVVDYFRRPSMGGNWPEWIRVLEDSIPNTLDAFCWYGRDNAPYGYGCVDMALTQRGEYGANRVPTAAQMATAAAYGLLWTPQELYRNARMLTVSPVGHVIVVTYTPAAGASSSDLCDWDANNNKRYVIAQTPGSKKIQVDSVYTSGVITSGDRVLLASHELIVDDGPGEGGLGLDEMSFTTWPSTLPADLTDRGDTVGFYVCSGGGQVMTAHDAEQTYLGSLGPARGSGTAAPKPGWQDLMVCSLIESAVSVALDGVDLPITAVAATIDGTTTTATPNYDSTSTIELLIPYEIQIWEDKSNV